MSSVAGTPFGNLARYSHVSSPSDTVPITTTAAILSMPKPSISMFEKLASYTANAYKLLHPSDDSSNRAVATFPSLPTSDLLLHTLHTQNQQLHQAYAELEQTAVMLAERNRNLTELSQMLDSVAENERENIAYELHDAVVNPFENQLALLKAKLAVGLTPVDLQSLYEELVEVRDSMRQGLLNLHAAELKEYGLYTAMLYMTRRIAKDQAFRLHQQINENLLEQVISENVQHAIYRITQQALQNVIKHAEATNVIVYLAIKADSTTPKVLLKISDDGKGFSVPPNFIKLQVANHNGLASFAQKVRLLGGKLDIASALGSGTSVSIELPLT
jgi:signal transduction histidine kinase